MDKLPEQIISREDIWRLRSAGFVIIPLTATDEMKRVGAPSCFIVPDGFFETAVRDAGECYAAKIELGFL